MSDCPERPIIVVGCPRSGTTMLQLMLHAHPRIAIPPETRFVLAAYRERRDFGDLRIEANRRALARRIVDRRETRFCDLGLDPEETVERMAAAQGTLGSVLGTVFQGYAARFGKPRWGDKRPAYLHNVDLLLRLFPDAQFVNIVRDGRDCVASLKEMSWHRKDIYATVAAWARAVDDARRAARRLGSAQWFELRYEDLVTDPHTQLMALCDYLGEDYDPAMAEPSAVAEVAVPSFKTWHARTHAPVNTERVRSWETRLTPEEIALCEAALGRRLVANGYELSGNARPNPADLVRYGWSATPQRFIPARRRISRAAVRLRPSEDLAHLPTAPLPRAAEGAETAAHP
ncbi:sulfotransferase family protein [Actinoplanes sp. RD1]|uniref:sulfotransferase family protein n=1 Tax=Actinoplanes sp. RD1 TaxID=3064538 RepID=UPI0027428225|nr:sulfotransferase [Actinoplanes sp. RD1]